MLNIIGLLLDVNKYVEQCRYVCDLLNIIGLLIYVTNCVEQYRSVFLADNSLKLV